MRGSGRALCTGAVSWPRRCLRVACGGTPRPINGGSEVITIGLPTSVEEALFTPLPRVLPLLSHSMRQYQLGANIILPRLSSAASGATI